MIIKIFFTLLLFQIANVNAQCNPKTKASGTRAPKSFCPGDLIFNENFDNLDTNVWKHESSLYGGYNGEFQWYTNDNANSYTRDGKLFITPTLTHPYLPCRCEVDLYRYALDLKKLPPYTCDISDEEGCYMQGKSDQIINPFRSARIKTDNSFRFRYGKVEVKAKMPRGNWLWPAVWLLPSANIYGGWPRSGEIDLIESRGNDEIWTWDGGNIGNEQVLYTLHYGATHQYKTNWINDKSKFSSDFHTFKMEWTPDNIKFQVDNNPAVTLSGPFGDGYTGSPNKMAPFDQEFYFILNLAVGGTNSFFPDNMSYPPNGKPWNNNDSRRVSQTKLWWSRQWESYTRNPEESSLQVDYIKVWAI